MSMNGWLALTEYSSKYKVSISTLRRRIKTGDIPCKFEDGKYLLKDASLGENRARPAAPAKAIAPPQQAKGLAHPVEVSEKLDHQLAEEGGPILTTANRLLNELKKAYAQILQEKEEQVLQLREEVADLKTLVRVLEEELNRVKAEKKTESQAPQRDFLGESWLSDLET